MHQDAHITQCAHDLKHTCIQSPKKSTACKNVHLYIHTYNLVAHQTRTHAHVNAYLRARTHIHNPYRFKTRKLCLKMTWGHIVTHVYTYINIRALSQVYLRAPILWLQTQTILVHRIKGGGQQRRVRNQPDAWVQHNMNVWGHMYMYTCRLVHVGMCVFVCMCTVISHMREFIMRECMSTYVYAIHAD
jgi:hypothetical protein